MEMKILPLTLFHHCFGYTGSFAFSYTFQGKLINFQKNKKGWWTFLGGFVLATPSRHDWSDLAAAAAAAVAYRILVPQPGIEPTPMPPAVEALCPKH